jgi:hypothetical protein
MINKKVFYQFKYIIRFLKQTFNWKVHTSIVSYCIIQILIALKILSLTTSMNFYRIRTF